MKEGLAVITAVMPTYGRKDVVFERGEGNYLYAADGRRYLDFTSGIAVNALGHCHPALVKALTEQGQKLWHTSNLFRIGNGEKLAKRLTEVSFADKVFFCNSGAEANEAAIKYARKATGKPGVLALEQSFHGRTTGSLAVTGQPAKRAAFSLHTCAGQSAEMAFQATTAASSAADRARLLRSESCEILA